MRISPEWVDFIPLLLINIFCCLLNISFNCCCSLMKERKIFHHYSCIIAYRFPSGFGEWENTYDRTTPSSPIHHYIVYFFKDDLKIPMMHCRFIASIVLNFKNFYLRRCQSFFFPPLNDPHMVLILLMADESAGSANRCEKLKAAPRGGRKERHYAGYIDGGSHSKEFLQDGRTFFVTLFHNLTTIKD